ncbi:MAG: hypothetical protein AAF724_12635 [Pseudomonadota bacterium]
MYETPEHLANNQADIADKVRSLGLGFKKVRLDPEIHARLMEHFRSSVLNFKSEPSDGFIDTDSRRAFPSLIFQDEAFNQSLLADLQPIHEKWSGQKLKKAACYGIRVYQPRSYLYNHIDRARTHVVSSTICIDCRLDNEWPLYIEDLDGNPCEVSVEPGEMVFFEGALLKHGRPYPLDGEYYANIFLHYTPLDWELDLERSAR